MHFRPALNPGAHSGANASSAALSAAWPALWQVVLDGLQPFREHGISRDDLGKAYARFCTGSRGWAHYD